MCITTMVYYVYILRSLKDGTYYIGHTADLGDRIQRHNDGRSSYTKAKAPWKLVYQEDFSSRSGASKREREIKRKRSRAYIEQLVRASKVLGFKPRRSRHFLKAPSNGRGFSFYLLFPHLSDHSSRPSTTSVVSSILKRINVSDDC